MIKIDKNIPMPRPRNKYRLNEMEVGDSFFVPGKTTQQLSGITALPSIRRTGKKFSARNVEEKDETTGKMVGGVRIWRIE